MKLGLIKAGIITMASTVLATAGLGLGCTETKKGEDVESSESMINGVATGEIRGVADVSNTIRTRLLDDSVASTAGFDISRVAGDPVFRLRRQLGVFVQTGTGTEYQGGTPTPFSLTLWHQVMGRFSEGFGRSCDAGATPNTVRFLTYTTSFGGGSSGFGGSSSGSTSGGSSDAGATTGTPFSLYPQVAAKVTAACKFEGDEAARSATAGTLFDTVMGRGASLAGERSAFVAEYAKDGSPWVTASAKDRVTSMFLGMMLNPHFLLAK
jgi:hypothetical protein